MPESNARVLLVDGKSSTRSSMSTALTENGYRVRSVADGFSALAEIHREAPEILISDLNIRCMRASELILLVKHRFPMTQVIAMNGGISSGTVPSGSAADAFFPKGGGIVSLLAIMASLVSQERIALEPAAAQAPIWMAKNTQSASGEASVMLECSECLKTFPEALRGTIDGTFETACVYCGSQIRYAIIQPEDRVGLSLFPKARPSKRLVRRLRRTFLMYQMTERQSAQCLTWLSSRQRVKENRRGAAEK
jgi:CheY-like chemotaxis protein